MKIKIQELHMTSHRFRITSIFFILSFFLSACGGGSGDSTSSNTAPVAQISSGSEFVEGTTFIDINAGNSSDSNGTVTSYQWNIRDNGGVSGLTIGDTTANVTQILGIPAVISQDIVITIGLVVTDNEGESSNEVTRTITIRNNTGAVDTSGFDGIWFSPCFNNRFGFSVRQTLNINGDSLTSDITSYTAGATPARNCITPSNGQTLFSDATADLSFFSDVSAANCLNGNGVDTDIDISSVTAGGNTFTNSNEISDALTLVTGYNDLIPNSSVICRTPNGNLIFGGSVYTPGPNTVNVDVIDANIDSEVSWQAGSNVYVGGEGASASDTVINANNSFGVVVVGTNQDTSNGDFSGSTLSITHTLSGSGLYQVKDQIDFNADNQISLDVVLGTGTTRSTSYVSANAINNVEVIVDDNGRYHFTLGSVIILDRGIEVNGGVPGAPNTIDFTMNNIFDYSN